MRAALEDVSGDQGFMSRTIAIAVSLALLGSTALAANLTHQLVVPNLNPGLKTVPSVPGSQSAKMAAAGLCEQQLITRIDSGTVIAGPDGLVAHLTGMASGVWGGNAELTITSTSPDGMTANADFTACRSPSAVDTPVPVATSLNLTRNAGLQSIIVHAQTNSMVLYTSKAH
jgi:hypothetical protein